jgi:hypothetical protein
MPCLDEDTVLRCAAGELGTAAEEAVEEHVADCAACAELLAAAARGLSLGDASPSPAPGATALELTRGQRVGRFEILGQADGICCHDASGRPATRGRAGGLTWVTPATTRRTN